MTGSPGIALRRLLAMSRSDLVIFDCDGVLVDSERLAVRTEAEILSGLQPRPTVVRPPVGRKSTGTVTAGAPP